MGCAQSTRQKVNACNEGGEKIQDEARSFRSKVGAGKLVLKNEAVRVEFRKFIEKEGDEEGRTEFVTYFETLEQMKSLPIEEQILQIRKLLEYTISTVDNNNNRNQMTSAIFSCLRPLRSLKLEKATHIEIAKALNAAQDLLVSAVTLEFEEFMDSEEFAELKRTNLENNIAKKATSDEPVKSQPIANKKATTISPPKMEPGFFGVSL